MNIKIIISEEIDHFEWLGGDVDYTYMIKEFLEKPTENKYFETLKNKPKRLLEAIDNWDFSVYTLEGDARELVSYGEIISDDTKSVDERLYEINNFENYAMMGSMIEDAREGLIFFKPLLDEYPQLAFNKCCEIFKKYLRDGGL
jgi:hypothetical protein